MSIPRSGHQYELRSGDYVAVVASVGATLRRLQHDGRDLVVPFEADEVRPAYRGATLAPWPNRVVDGRYAFAGAEHRLPITEPARGHALHGLVAWAGFTALDVADDSVLLRTRIEPQAGYPFRLDVETEYRLDEHGLHQTVTGWNIGADPAPWGTAAHPYLLAEPGTRVDAWSLELPASQVLTVTPDRLSPLALERIQEHPEWDFRVGRPIGDVFIDHAFTGLGRPEARLLARSGRGVAISWTEDCPWVQIHTADDPQNGRLHRSGLAVEPMTCAPDAYNEAGYDFPLGLEAIPPGERSREARWAIRAIG